VQMRVALGYCETRGDNEFLFKEYVKKFLKSLFFWAGSMVTWLIVLSFKINLDPSISIS